MVQHSTVTSPSLAAFFFLKQCYQMSMLLRLRKARDSHREDAGVPGMRGLGVFCRAAHQTFVAFVVASGANHVAQFLIVAVQRPVDDASLRGNASGGRAVHDAVCIDFCRVELHGAGTETSGAITEPLKNAQYKLCTVYCNVLINVQ